MPMIEIITEERHRYRCIYAVEVQDGLDAVRKIVHGQVPYENKELIESNPLLEVDRIVSINSKEMTAMDSATVLNAVRGG